MNRMGSLKQLVGRRGVIAGIVGTVAIAGAGGLGFIYFDLMGGNSPSRLTLSAAATSTPSATESASASASATASTEGAGTWTIASGSVAGYRVREQLAELPAPSDAVGRTSSITGTVTLQSASGGSQVSAASFIVDVTTLTSDRSMRDNRIRVMGLESSRYPTATFTLTSPIALPAGAASGQAFTVQATGDLTIHGVARSVTIPLQAQLQGSKIQVVGSITFPFSEFGMTPPSIGGFVTVQDNATMEFQLFFQHT